MPQYFFHVIEADERLDDLEGLNLLDLYAAQAIAMMSARDLMAQDIRSGELSLFCVMEVTDEAGTIVYHLPFDKAVTIRGEPYQSALAVTKTVSSC